MERSAFFLRFGVAALILHGGSTGAQEYVPPSGPFYEHRERMEAHFASLRSSLPDSVFNSEGGEYAQYQRWVGYWEPRLAPHGDPDQYDRLLKNYADVKFNNSSSFKSNNDPWHEIGPKRIANNMFGIGPIRHLTVFRDDPDHMLCTSNSGGLFYTTDASSTCTWNNANTDIGLPHSGCNWADYYPGVPQHWYTLSSYDSRISYVGGLYRSTNSGAEWERVADHLDLGGPSVGTYQFIFDRKWNDQNDHRMFLATSKGLFVSENPAGANPTWVQVPISAPPSISSAYPAWVVDPEVRVFDMEYLPLDPTSTLCATMRFRLTEGPDAITVWRFMISTNNGDTWTEVANQPPIDLTITSATIETSAAAPDIFYCHVADGSNSWVKKFDVATQTWTGLVSGFQNVHGQGHAFGVDQFNPNSFMVGRWIDLNWYVNEALVPYPYPPAPRQYAYSSTGHDDVEVIVGDPLTPGIFWVANHGGVSKINTNVSPRTWEYKCEGLGVAEVWSMSTSQNKPDYVALGLYHDCHVLTRTPYGSSWDPDWSYLNQYGDGTLALIDPQDANVVYHADQGGRWQRNDHAETSDIADATWSSANQFYSEGALNRSTPSHLYSSRKISGEIEIERSFNKGANRVVVSDFTNDLNVNHPIINSGEQFWWIRASTADPDHLYVGLQNWDWQQRIYRNTNIDHPDAETVKSTWEDVPHPRRAPLGSADPDREPIVVDVAFDTEDPHTIYLAYAASQAFNITDQIAPLADRMVYRMNVSDLSVYPVNTKFDCGGDLPCADITMNLPNTIADKDGLEFEQGSDGGLYFATEAGVYFTDNKRIAAYDPLVPEDADDLSNTSGWVRVGGALPHIGSIGLEINYQVNRLRVGTTGRGVWEHGLHCPPDIDLVETVTYNTPTFLEVQASITSEATVPTVLKVDYRGGTSVHLIPGFHASNGSRFHAFVHPCDAPGNSFKPKNLVSDEPTEEPRRLAVSAVQSLELFPNPAHESLWVRCGDLSEDALAQLRLYDATGRVVFATIMRGPLKHVDVSGFTGLLTVVLDAGDKRHTGRVIVQD